MSGDLTSTRIPVNGRGPGQRCGLYPDSPSQMPVVQEPTPRVRCSGGVAHLTSSIAALPSRRRSRAQWRIVLLCKAARRRGASVSQVKILLTMCAVQLVSGVLKDIGMCEGDSATVCSEGGVLVVDAGPASRRLAGWTQIIYPAELVGLVPCIRPCG
jgi:hypothetical protein